MGVAQNAKARREASDGGRKTTKDDGAYVFDQTDHAAAISVRLVSLRVLRPALSFEEQRALTP